MKGNIQKATNEINRKGNIENLYNRIQKVLADDNLVCKPSPEGQDSLFRAVSQGLYFTSIYYKVIQELCMKHLGNLITTNQLPPRLEMFRGNPILWNSYSNNPLSDQFCEINLELVSSAFRVRVIVYTVNDDEILSAKIFNNKFERDIQLIQPFGCHFDVVYSQKFMKNIAFCHNIVLTLLSRGFHLSQTSHELEGKSFNTDKHNLSHTNVENSEMTDIESREERHGLRRVMSDPKLKTAECGDDSQNRLDFYKSFMDSKPTHEISNFVEKDSTKAEKKEDEAPKSNQLNEQKTNEKSGAEESGGLRLGIVRSIPGSTRAIIEEEDDELLTPDFNAKLEKSKSCLNPKAQQKSPVHFINSLPPGLTPNRYSTKTYGNEDFSQAVSTNNDVKMRPKSGSYSQHDDDHFALNAHLLPKPRTVRALSLSTQSEEFRKNPILPIPENELNPQGLHKNPTPEKKKPVIIDESHHRYTGRLKFFDEGKSYGFIVMDDDGSDIFVHYDDLHKANITKEFLKTAKFGNSVRLSFSCLEYIGKYNRSRKATDIQFLNP